MPFNSGWKDRWGGGSGGGRKGSHGTSSQLVVDLLSGHPAIASTGGIHSESA
jgi:hypothetical protein